MAYILHQHIAEYFTCKLFHCNDDGYHILWTCLITSNLWGTKPDQWS